MICNGKSLLQAEPLSPMASEKHRSHGVSYGMSEAGYDIRIKQEIRFQKPENSAWVAVNTWFEDGVKFGSFNEGRFTIASTIEEFHMPLSLVGIVHDKSTWARRGLSVFNTVIEPGWKGFLTLELVYHGNEDLIIPAGAGIAQVTFHETTDQTAYSGKYQNQPDRPVAGIFTKD